MIVYYLSGIGADQRIFTHINLPEGVQSEYIYWNLPLPDEPLEEYAYRLFLPYNTAEPFVLLGISIGGIIAVEIAKEFKPICTIIISSVPIAAHFPYYYRVAKKLKLHNLLPATLFKITATIKHYLFLKSAQNKKLLRQIIWDSDAEFIKWGINAVLEWDNAIVPEPFYHIHGTRDEVFPLVRTKPTHILSKAGHMLVMSHPAEVNAILREILLPLLS